MKKLKTNTGITLVALIITIIVLLILAVVSIRVITGGEGIFAKTENATQKYEDEKRKEENTINEYGSLIDVYSNNGGIADSGTGTKLYDAVVSNPSAFIGAKVTGYRANGYSEWKIFDASSDGYVRIVPNGEYGSEYWTNNVKYTYDTSKTNQENKEKILEICNRYVNSQLANSATLMTVNEYGAYYNNMANYSANSSFLYDSENDKIVIGEGGWRIQNISTNIETPVLQIISLKADVLLKDGGSLDTGYEIYIKN